MANASVNGAAIPAREHGTVPQTGFLFAPHLQCCSVLWRTSTQELGASRMSRLRLFFKLHGMYHPASDRHEVLLWDPRSL